MGDRSHFAIRNNINSEKFSFRRSPGKEFLSYTDEEGFYRHSGRQLEGQFYRVVSCRESGWSYDLEPLPAIFNDEFRLFRISYFHKMVDQGYKF